MHRLRYLVVLVILCSGIACSGFAQRDFTVACWNVENLFDTIPSGIKNDQDFTPNGSCRWNGPRYWRKLSTVARTIAAMGGAEPCCLVGLVEVENDSVLRDLTQRTSLGALGYQYIVTHGPDVRGINVALLYQPFRFRPIGFDTLRIETNSDTRPTRDLLHVWGCMSPSRENGSCDTLDVMVVHLPSHRGGNAADKLRQNVANRLVQSIDSIVRVRTCPQVIVMGDFNASPDEKIFSQVLASFELLTGKLDGTYNYREEWSQIDHFLAAGRLTTLFSPQVSVFHAPYLERRVPQVKRPIPNRTYYGTHYHGGVSDHFPILLKLSPIYANP